MYQPYCSVQSSNGVIEALEEHYSFKFFTRQEVETNFFDNVDCVCFPGGFGDAGKFDFLLRQNKPYVIDYIQQGGKYLGICMGSYWAGPHYFNITKHITIEQYITRPTADTRRPHAKQMPVQWNNQPETMFFYDGPTFIGDKFVTISTYPNNDPMAIIQNNIGLIGCHPEATPYWYQQYSWMKGKWTDNRLLLKQFVDCLIEV